MSPADRHIGRRIRGKRLALALSQQDLAQAVVVTPDKIEAYETGRTPVPAPVLNALADFFNVPLSYFYPSGTNPGG